MKFEDDIKRYLDSKLNEKEKQTFEETVRADTELKEELEFQGRLKFIVENEDLLKVNEMLFAIGKNTELSPDSGDLADIQKIHKEMAPSSNWLWWGIGSLALVLACGVAFFLTRPTDSQISKVDLVMDSLGTVHLAAPELLINASQERNKTLYDATISYREGDYAEALKLFKPHIDGNENVRFYYGICLLLEKQNGEAEKVFEELKSIEGFFFEEENNWYLLQTYLQEKDLEKVLKEAAVLEDSESYSKQAKDIIQALQVNM